MTRKQKIVRAIIGFIGWYLINGLFLVGSIVMGNSETLLPFLGAYGLLVSLFNGAALIALVVIKATRWVAFGVLLAIAFLFALGTIAGIFLLVACFIALATSGSGG